MPALLALAFLTLAMPAAAQPADRAPVSLGETADRQAVAETLALLVHGVDARAWDAVRQLYADTVRLDYTSLNGGEPADLDADALLASWQGVLPGFELTHHQLGPAAVTLDGDQAAAACHLRATHRIEGARGGETWVVGGHYAFRLRRDPGAPRGWAITDHALLNAFQEGNRGLPALAQQRAAAGAAAAGAAASR